MSPVSQQRGDGRWLPAEPLPEPFGIVWERAAKHRMSLGQSRIRAYACGWLDARSISCVASALAAGRDAAG